MVFPVKIFLPTLSLCVVHLSSKMLRHSSTMVTRKDLKEECELQYFYFIDWIYLNIYIFSLSQNRLKSSAMAAFPSIEVTKILLPEKLIGIIHSVQDIIHTI
jgi:hypothetical protein